jgi:hypothetical protein
VKLSQTLKPIGFLILVHAQLPEPNWTCCRLITTWLILV